jgi:DeoR family transcriptional regulator, suf operon transcriptional repressor
MSRKTEQALETTQPVAGFGATQSALLRLLLHNKPGLTVDRIAGEIGVTRTAVNQHLAALERDGHIASNDVVATGGRPGRVYALTESGFHRFPKNYDAFSLHALEALIDALGAEQTHKILEQIGRNIAQDCAALLDGKNLDARIHTIVDILQGLGFDAEIDASPGPQAPPEIRAYNCIYHTLAKAHPDVCTLDLAFLREAAGADVEHAACMATGANTCRFRFASAKKD